MFKLSEGKSKSRAKLPLTIFRLFLSLALFCLLGVAFIQAFKYFSGTSSSDDPFTTAINEFPSNPKQAVVGLLTSEDTVKVITDILSFTPAKDFKLPLQNKSDNKSTSQQAKKSGNEVLKFAIVADSHKDNDMLKTALSDAKSSGAKFVIGLGDFSDVGTIDELEAAKSIFDESKLPYYVIPGDHDLWDSRDKGKAAVANFSQVFGTPYQAFSDSGIRFLLVYNSDNYNGVDGSQFNWIENELDKKNDNQKSIYVFLHEPLVHSTSDQVMGSPRKSGEATPKAGEAGSPRKSGEATPKAGEAGSVRKSDQNVPASSKIQSQAKELLDIFNKAKVGGIFAGDIHAFTTYTDMTTNINMATIGSLTKERNTQTPRFAIVDVYDDGGYNISDIEVK